jgi:hypothetical protein
MKMKNNKAINLSLFKMKKMFVEVFTIIIVLVLVSTTMPSILFADSDNGGGHSQDRLIQTLGVISETVGTITWSYDTDTRALNLTGTGTVPDVNWAYKSDIVTISIGAGITAVESAALSGLSSLTDIYFEGTTIPSGFVSSLGNNQMCTVHIPFGSMASYNAPPFDNTASYTLTYDIPFGIISAEQVGGTNGKTFTTAIKVTFDRNVTPPPDSAFTIISPDDRTKKTDTVTDAGDSDDRTWTIGVKQGNSGTWSNGPSNVQVAVASFGGYESDGIHANVSVMYAPVPIVIPSTVTVDYVNQTLTGLNTNRNFIFNYTYGFSSVSGTFSTDAAGNTTWKIPDAIMANPTAYNLQIQAIALDSEPLANSEWKVISFNTPPAVPPGQITETDDYDDYTVLENFGTFDGSGTLNARINADDKLFVRLVHVGDEKVLSRDKDYTVTHGSTIITLAEAYLKTLAPGHHQLRAEYSTGENVIIDLYIAEKKYVVITESDETESTEKENTGTGTQEPGMPASGSPDTADDSNMMLWICLMATSIITMVMVWLYMLRRRE